MEIRRIHKSSLDARTKFWTCLTEGDEALSFAKVFSRWTTDGAFRNFWSASLREVEFDAYCWECPPLTVSNASRPFECVFVSSTFLARIPPDPDPFAEYFRRDREVATFESLGKDALLIAPCPEGPDANFSHLASFVATASESRQDALWSAVGRALEHRLSARPLWLSTAGGGVAWLHVRLDSTPKYYRHFLYRHVT